MKKITIIMPTYNQSKYIQEAIDSVLSQTFKNFELIIVDDGSTDETPKIIDEQTDPRISIIHKKNGGTGSALNIGFDIAMGDYETWLASDNKYHHKALEEMYNILESRKDVDFVYCNCEIMIMSRDGNFINSRKNYNEEVSMIWDAHKYYERHNIGVIWLWRKELRIKAGDYFIVDPCEDYEMVTRMIEAGGQFHYYPKVLGFHRRHNQNLSYKLTQEDLYIHDLIKRMVKKRDNIKTNKPSDVPLEKKLTKIYNEFGWGGKESRSGSGSDVIQTKELIAQLPKFLKRINARKIIDAPCGDWNWMKRTIQEIEFDSYIGIDIIDEEIERNKKEYATSKIHFKKMNLIEDELTDMADVIICRDMFNHLTFEHIEKILLNFYNSDSRYVLMTNFTKSYPNVDLSIKSEGIHWRPIDFTKPPFNFSSPLETLNERCPEESFEDKELALWKLRRSFQ